MNRNSSTTTYQELIKQPEKAVEFGERGFVFKHSTWEIIAKEAWLRSIEAMHPDNREFERHYEAIELHLANELTARVKDYARQPH